jgi:hypothetical protein
MKIQITIANNKINVYSSHHKKQTVNKSFNILDYVGVLDYAVSLDNDRYILSCSQEIMDFAKLHNHSFLKRKIFVFT